MNDDWKKRLTDDLEPELTKRDPRPAISAYHDMPYAIFRYPPEAEFTLREELSLLVTRLEIWRVEKELTSPTGSRKLPNSWPIRATRTTPTLRSSPSRWSIP